MRTRQTRNPIAVLGSTLVVLFASHSAEAAPTLRVEVDQRGDFVLIGNTLGQDCAPSIPKPDVGDVGDVGNCGTNADDLAPDVFWRSDSPENGKAEANTLITAPTARSTAMLTLPPNATVTHAFLYWAAAMPSGVNNGGASATFERPDQAFSKTVNALTTYRTTRTGTAYQSVADVTGTVKDFGSGAYRVGGIDSINLVNLNSNGNTVFAGWWMVVFYNLDSDSARNLALFDGLDAIQNQGNDGLATLSGFYVPQNGFTATLGVVGFAGSNVPGAASANSLKFGNTFLSDELNPSNNFFNATHSLRGSPVSTLGDLPRLTGTPGSMSGVDIDVVDVTNLVTPGQSSAVIQATATNQNSFLLAGLITSISTLQPDFAGSVKSVRDINGGALVAGDVLEYSIVVTNRGNDGSVNTVLTDSLPDGVTYVPHSLVVQNGANADTKTDIEGDDQADYDPNRRTVTFRLGTGANAANGGRLAVGESTTISFQVRVNDDATGTIANQAFLTSSGASSAQNGAPSFTSPTTGDPANPNSPTVVVVVVDDTCNRDADCNADAPFCKTDTHPFSCVECLSDDHCTAPGATCHANACIAPAPKDAGADASFDGGSSDAGPSPTGDASRPGASPNSAADEASGVGAFCNARPTAPTSGWSWLLGAAGVTILARLRKKRKK